MLVIVFCKLTFIHQQKVQKNLHNSICPIIECQIHSDSGINNQGNFSPSDHEFSDYNSIQENCDESEHECYYYQYSSDEEYYYERDCGCEFHNYDTCIEVDDESKRSNQDNKEDDGVEEVMSTEVLHEEPKVNELRVWAVTCRIPKVHLNALLRILHNRLIPNLPLCSQTLLRTTSARYKIQKMTDIANLDGEYVYLGIESGLKKCVNPSLHSNRIL